MKFSHLVATLQLAGIAVASPLFIVTGLPENHNVLQARKPPSPTDPFASLVSSFFGGDDPTPTPSTVSLKTLPPPAIATSTPSPPSATTSEEESSAPSAAPSTTSDVQSTSTSTTTASSSSAPTTSSAPSTTSSAPSSTITPPPSSTSASAASSTSAAASSQSNSGNGMPTAGIVVLAIFAVIIIAVIVWAVFRYHPRARGWWVARMEKGQNERTYREALDGPAARFSGAAGGAGVSQLRQKALGDEGPSESDIQSEKSVSTRRSMLHTFFAPATAKLGNGQEIKRKPVQWGEPSPSSPRSLTSFGSDKMSLAQTAAPMGRSASNKNMPFLPQRLSVAAHPDYGLPPTMPGATDQGVQKAKRGSDGVYRLN